MRRPFTIARGTATEKRVLICEYAREGIVGLGETAPIDRYGESCASVRAWFEENADVVDGLEPLDHAARTVRMPPAVRCAADLAAHDWLARSFELPLWRYLGIPEPPSMPTSFTLGIDAPDLMREKLEEARDAPILKIKLGARDDVEIVRAIRERYAGRLRIDANEAWTPEEAARKLVDLRACDVEFCEQPIPAGHPERLRWIRERTDIPLVADEDARDVHDIPRLRGCVDGVNVKLVKTGGVHGALEMIRVARAAGLKIMLGCMIESSLLTTAAAHLTGLADWADLDGPLLIADDPFVGVRYEAGRVIVPSAPGLGVARR